MNWDQIEGQWSQLKGRVREMWGKLTDDDVEAIAGKKDRLIGALQVRYGRKKDLAEKEIESFAEKVGQTIKKKVKSKKMVANR